METPMRRPLLALLLALVVLAAPFAVPAVGAQEPSPSERTSAVATALAASGLPVIDLRVTDYDAEAGFAVSRYTGTVALITWLDQGNPGRPTSLELFADEARLHNRLSTYEMVLRHERGPFVTRVYTNAAQHALLVLPPTLTPEQAAGYEAWLQSL